MQRDEGKYGYDAHPTEDDIFEWHFTIHGPPDSDFEGGIYHGRINLPPEYPFKPPAIMLLTESGRFEINKKICLSISNYHPEHWQPSWDLRTIITALVAFMPTEGGGAIGALDCPPEERKRLAVLSRKFVCPKCGDKAEDFAARVPVPESPEKKPSSTTTTPSASPAIGSASPASSPQPSPAASPATSPSTPSVPAAVPPPPPEPQSSPTPPRSPARQPMSPASQAQRTQSGSDTSTAGGWGALEWLAVAVVVLLLS